MDDKAYLKIYEPKTGVPYSDFSLFLPTGSHYAEYCLFLNRIPLSLTCHTAKDQITRLISAFIASVLPGSSVKRRIASSACSGHCSMVKLAWHFVNKVPVTSLEVFMEMKI